jgi:hypothetical protein
MQRKVKQGARKSLKEQMMKMKLHEKSALEGYLPYFVSADIFFKQIDLKL